MNRLKQALAVLRAGGVIAFPTETVFGIGALISKKTAVRRIFRMKKRPLSKPLQVLVADLKQARKLGRFGPKALALAKASWPGPLTLVVRKKRAVPSWVVSGGKTVGIRIPDHKTAIALLRLSGPLAATSANLSEARPALTAKDVKNSLQNVDYIVPGRVKTGVASKVIDTTRKLKLLRS